MTFYVHPTAIIDDGCVIGHGTKIWHFSHVMAGAVVGQNCVIGQNVFIASSVRLGNGVKVQNNVSLFDGVTCEDEVFLGPSMVFTNVINPRSAIDRKKEILPTVVRKGSTIGANATVICGNEIGTYSFIAAGTVVTKNVAAFSLVQGNPGKAVGWVSERGHRLSFGIDGAASCPETGEIYLLENNFVRKR